VARIHRLETGALVHRAITDDRGRYSPGPVKRQLIGSTFGLQRLTAREAHAENLGQVLERSPRRPVHAGAIPTSSQVLGPVSDAAAVCSAGSVQSVSPAPAHVGERPADAPALSQPGMPTGAGMVGFGRQYRKGQAG
jgi:phospholipase C